MHATQPKMKAIHHDQYGPLESLRLCEVDTPRVAAGEALVRVRAAGLHVGDCFAVRGAPAPVRLFTGLLRPKCGIPGFDLAGEVEQVGLGVERFRPGDEVFGAAEGTCAEFVAVKLSTLAPKPRGLSFEDAAAMPTSGLTALHALRDVAKVQAGQRVLINGASGGVGSFAVQIAKSYGAIVTGVCSTANVELVRSLGADHVIDYTQQDFTQGGPSYDVILDNVENRFLTECRRALRPDGMLILNSGSGATGLGLLVRLLKPVLLSPFVRHRLRRYLSTPNEVDLLALSELVSAGRLRSVVSKVYPLAETVTALRQIDAGHARGKLVISVAD